MKVLVVVDMQKDFVDGSLGTKEAVQIVPNVINKIKNFDGIVVYTKDSHPTNYLERFEGRHLPVVHCITNTPGWEFAKGVYDGKGRIFEKDGFGSSELVKYLLSLDNIEEIEVCGLCTDICVVTNVLLIKTYFNETLITVDASCCAGVTVEAHNAAILTMKMCQINIINE